jgi:hypothetical protein
MYRVCFFSSPTNKASALLIVSSLEPTLPHLTVRYHPMSTKEHPAIMDPPHSPSYRYAPCRQLYSYVPKRHLLVKLYQGVETFHKPGSFTKIARNPDLSSADVSRTWHILTAVVGLPVRLRKSFDLMKVGFPLRLGFSTSERFLICCIWRNLNLLVAI